MSDKEIKILKYRKQFQTRHETPRVFRPASGNSVPIYVFYQLPLCLFFFYFGI